MGMKKLRRGLESHCLLQRDSLRTEAGFGAHSTHTLDQAGDDLRSIKSQK